VWRRFKKVYNEFAKEISLSLLIWDLAIFKYAIYVINIYVRCMILNKIGYPIQQYTRKQFTGKESFKWVNAGKQY
jgi:hypothetical protein